MNNSKQKYREYFSSGVVNKLPDKKLNDFPYGVFQYFIPKNMRRKVRFLRRYFYYLDSQNKVSCFKRRKHPEEFVEQALIFLTRLNILMKNNSATTIGSGYVCPVAWAAFGKSTRPSKHRFLSAEDVARHYANHLHGPCMPLEVIYRSVGYSLASGLAQCHDKPPMSSPNYWVTVALALTYEAVHYCGPDCRDVFELYTNDLRHTPENYDISLFEGLRSRFISNSPGAREPSRPACSTPERLAQAEYRYRVSLRDIGRDLMEGTKYVRCEIPKSCATDSHSFVGPLASDFYYSQYSDLPHDATLADWKDYEERKCWDTRRGNNQLHRMA